MINQIRGKAELAEGIVEDMGLQDGRVQGGMEED